MLSSMAQSFGISVPLLDGELSRFIAAGRISAKIDKVLGTEYGTGCSYMGRDVVIWDGMW